MNNKSRTKNVSLNLIYSVVAQVLTVLLNLLSRTVFIRTLGVSYLGINGLFSNIINVLSLAELGVGEAIIYTMYKPLAENDTKRVAALINYYRKLYFYIACIIALVGLLLFPFIDFFVNLEVEIPHIRYYYLLFLVQAVSSYLVVYRTSILTADQKNYVITKTTIAGNIISIILQMVVLISTHSYILYILVQIIIGIIINVVNSKLAVNNYPYISEKHNLENSEKKLIWSNIHSMFSYKIGGVVLNNTDNLLISKIISTTILGFYSNYSLIMDKVSGMVGLIFTSLQASLGNYNTEKSSENMYFMFKVISLVEYWVYIFCSLCFCLLFNDFITIWVGEEFILSMQVIYICVINFYIKGVLYPIWCYRNTTGLFKKTRYMMFIAATINLICSVVLGVKFGLSGILGATAISRLCTNVWYEPKVLFNNYFKKSVKNYYIKEFIRFVQVAMLCYLSVQLLDDFIFISNINLRFIIKIIYCIIVPNVFIIIENRKNKEFRYLIEKVKKVLLRDKQYN